MELLTNKKIIQRIISISRNDNHKIDGNFILQNVAVKETFQDISHRLQL